MGFEGFKSLSGLKQEIHIRGLTIPLSEDIKLLKEPITVGNKTIYNRLAIQPMEGCDGTIDGKLDDLTIRRYQRFAKGGAGILWFEAVAVSENGRANKRQLLINRENLDNFKQAVEMIKEEAMKEIGFVPLLIMQATHSGRYSKPLPVIAYQNPIHERKRPISGERLIGDDELKNLEEKYGEGARLAEEAGFDGIDIKACHGYLICELLSAYTRAGEYGGSFENRTRLFINAIKSAKSSAGSDFLITSRLNVYDGFEYPYGFGMSKNGGLEDDLTEPIQLVDILHNRLGLKLLNVTMGNPYENPHVNRPYSVGLYKPNENPLVGVDRMYRITKKVQERFPALIVISSGATYLREYGLNLAAGAIEQGCCKIVGFGRQAFAYPNFAKDGLSLGKFVSSNCCITCGKCTELMRAGSTAGCVIHDRDVYLSIYKKDVKMGG